MSALLPTRLSVPALAALLVGCSGTAETKTYQTGSYSDARVRGQIATELAAEGEVPDGEVQIDCPSADALADISVEGGDTLTIDATAVADAGCTARLHGPGMQSIDIDDQDDSADAELILTGQADLRLEEVVAGDLYVMARGGSNVEIDRMDCDSMELDYSGGGQLWVKSTRADRVALQAHGNAQVTLDDTESREFDVDASGDAEVQAEGACEDATLTASGSALIDAEGMEAQDAEVNTDGDATVSLTVLGSITGSAGGSSSVTISGDPEGAIETTGSASVTIGGVL